MSERTPMEMLEVVYARATEIRARKQRRFRVGLTTVLVGVLGAAAIGTGALTSGGDHDVAGVDRVSPTYWFLDGPTPTGTDFTVEIHGGACVFGDVEYDRPVVDHVDVDETADTAVVTVFVRPGHPRPAEYADEEFCPDVATVDQVPVHLDTALGDRLLVDGSCDLIDSRPRPMGVRCGDSSFPGYARDIAAALPDGTNVQAVTPNAGEGSRDEIYFEGKDLARLTVTIYRTFDKTEVASNGSTLPADNGSAWTGAEDPDLTSIYYLATNGVGLWIASQQPGGTPLEQSQLVELAETIATVPSVIERAGVPDDGSHRPPSQTPAAALRDAVIPEIAALPTSERVDGHETLTSDEGTWVLSRLTEQANTAVADDEYQIGDASGVYGTDFVSSYEYGELLLLDDTGEILRAYPMPGAIPSWLYVSADAVYAGRIGDGGQSVSTIFRIDRSTLDAQIVAFPTVDSAGPWPVSWHVATPSESARYEALVAVGPTVTGAIVESETGRVALDIAGIDSLIESAD